MFLPWEQFQGLPVMADIRNDARRPRRSGFLDNKRPDPPVFIDSAITRRQPALRLTGRPAKEKSTSY